MYERFTDRARRVMQLANREAARLNHEYIGTEHILLGLVAEGSGVAANVLRNLDVDLQAVRREVEQIVHPGPGGTSVERTPQTPRAKQVIDYAVEEAHFLHHNYVGTEHILLGLLRVQEGVAAQVLMNLRVRLDNVREEVIALLGGGTEEALHAAVRDTAHVNELDLPPDVLAAVREIDSQIEQLNRQKEDFVAEQDFNSAARLRDQTDQLKKRRASLLREWQAGRFVDPAWLTWNDGAVPRIARTIRVTRKWEELPVLADALEEAGCTDREMLDHCRQPGRHGSGCWVIDLLLHHHH